MVQLSRLNLEVEFPDWNVRNLSGRGRTKQFRPILTCGRRNWQKGDGPAISKASYVGPGSKNEPFEKFGLSTAASFEARKAVISGFCRAADFRVTRLSYSCLTYLAEQVETAFCFDHVASDCSVGSSTDGLGGHLLAWLLDGPLRRYILFGGAVVLSDEHFFALQGGCRNRILTERKRRKIM